MPTAEEKAAKKAAEQAAIAAVGIRKVAILRSHPAYAYNAGDKAELSDVHADVLVKGGFARYDEAETAEAPTDETR
ncbi:hypothetical protein [Hymenobacter convexus]|uniref:hypothetical protein n=1 Tax=Hymenobacter sp. CA1UV-4 TaxID=3063782 RepID=UPI0027138186|nr:hypothetical protein [Hymenobacter sp. CA1UV-4]MDO7851393.1 hypothetical protein [Hymenobacter sp. CA1UV-4]